MYYLNTQAFYFIANGKPQALNSEIANGKNRTARADLFLDENIPGQLYAKFSNFAPWGDYKVIVTDYNQTSLVFSCSSIGISHWKWAWVLVRDVSSKVPEFYSKLINDYGIPDSNLMNTEVKNCELYKEDKDNDL